MRSTRLLGLLLAALLFALSACGGSDGGDTEASQDPSSATASDDQSPDASATEPDLDGIPDVVAEVNGEKVAKDDFVDAYTAQFQAAQSQAGAEPVDEAELRKQVADDLVNARLLVQEADQRGFRATGKQTDAALSALAEQNGLSSPDEFVASLAERGLDRDAVLTLVRDQVRIDQLLSDIVGDSKPSERELREYYEELKERRKQTGGQEIPPYKQARPILAQQLASQQEAQAADTLVKQLRKDADIEIFV